MSHIDIHGNTCTDPTCVFNRHTEGNDLKPSDSEANIKVTSESPTPPPTSEIDSKLDKILAFIYSKPKINGKDIEGESVSKTFVKSAITNLIAQEANRAVDDAFGNLHKSTCVRYDQPGLCSCGVAKTIAQLTADKEQND
jgi:hypothetical protein